MSYIINKTDGTVLTEIVDGTIDQVSTDLTLLGKNSSFYGEYWNENFIHVLENFANTSSPNHPLLGQLWFDTTENRLKVYNGIEFKSTNGTLVSTTAPTTLSSGDLWINSERQQMYFNDGGENILAGPLYSKTQGLSGFVVSDVLGEDNLNYTIVSLYVAKVLLGIFSKSVFTPKNPIIGYTKDLIAVYVTGSSVTGNKIITIDASSLQIGRKIKFNTAFGTVSNTSSYYVYTIADDNKSFTIATEPSGPALIMQEVSLTTPVVSSFADISNQINVGFNVATLTGFKLNATAASAEALIDDNGNSKKLSNIVFNNSNSLISGTLTIAKTIPLVLGGTNQNQFNVDNNEFSINSNYLSQHFKIKLITPNELSSQQGSLLTALEINPTTKTVSIYPSNDLPYVTPKLNVNGDVVVGGNLTVSGETLIVNSTNLEVKDKLIVIGKTDTPTDITAAGGGIELKGATDKTITWGSANGWTSSESLNLASSKTYKINGVTVISGTSLGSSIISAPGLTSVGTLSTLTVDHLTINDNMISSDVGDIVISPFGTGLVDVNNSRIVNVSDSVENGDAVNFGKFKTVVYSRPLAISMDITSFPGDDSGKNTTIASYLIKLFPPADDYNTGTKCRVYCTNSGIITVRQFSFIKSSGVWSFESNL